MQELEKFIKKIPNFDELSKIDQIDFFAYYLLFKNGNDYVTVSQINNCFDKLDIGKYARISSYLSENSRGKNKKYNKMKTGYRLERNKKNEIEVCVTDEPQKVSVCTKLSDLQGKLSSNDENVFLDEVLNCYKVEAYRASIIMAWNLTIWHIENFVLNEKLIEFNSALAKSPVKNIKQIVVIDDFSELKEVKFIELLRTARIISNDVRKILDEKLGIRNSAAHPSSIIIEGHKATEFILDLVKNVILKYN